MKILQLSTFDGRFGASIAARRLHEALLENGIDCSMLVSERLTDALRTFGPRSGFEKFRAKVRHQIDKWPLHLYPHRQYLGYSANWVPSTIHKRVRRFQSDAIHMHWCQSNFIPTPILPLLGDNLVWTFHDMWAFTGGCHYSSGCQRYLDSCGKCPALKSSGTYDLSYWLLKQKRATYRKLRSSLQIICPSRWLAEVARSTPVLEGIPVYAVPNPISTEVFKPIDKKVARQLLGLPEEGPLVLCGATAKGDRRKGFDLLEEALRLYCEQNQAEPLGIVTLGMGTASSFAANPKLRAWNINFLHDEVSLSALYSAVDVVALPSREENLSNALAESLCCGTPSLAFNIGGNSDLISHQINGYLAKAYDTADMATGLAWILTNLREKQRHSISQAAAAMLSSHKLVPAFLKIYERSYQPETAPASTSRPLEIQAPIDSLQGLEIITHDPGGYHVSLDTVWEFEKAVLAEPGLRTRSSRLSPLSLLPNVVWRKILGLLPDDNAVGTERTRPPKKPPFRRDYFTVLMGPNLRKTLPRFLLSGRKSVYLFDAWPATHETIRRFAGTCHLDFLFLSSQQGTVMLGAALHNTSCHWIPEGIDPTPYRWREPAKKDIDVLQLGRRFDSYHRQIVDALERNRSNYLYEKQTARIIFPTRESYLDGLARSKISICVPATLTHPEKAGGIETMTVRYLQSMLSKCLIVGHAPKETLDLFGYNPVIEIDPADPSDQILHILNHLKDYADLIEKNYQTVLAKHTWRHRWSQIRGILSS